MQHPLYPTWMNMKQRCLCKTYKYFKDYGGRGIKVCDRWLESFWNFVEDMGERPIGTSLDRIDNNENYEPSNCKWSTDSEQQRNRRDNRYITVNGITLCIADWEKKLNTGKDTIGTRKRKGWSDYECIYGKGAKPITDESQELIITNTQKG